MAAQQKATKAKKKSVPSGPSTLDQVLGAIAALKEPKGSSASAVKKYLKSKGVDTEKKNTFINKALNKGVSSGQLKQVKGTGATGTFKLDNAKAKATEKAKVQKEKAKVKKAAAAEKAKAKKAAKAEKKATKKKATKKPAAKKPAAKKAAKKPAAKKPAAKKPAAKKPAAKKPAAKKAAPTKK